MTAATNVAVDELSWRWIALMSTVPVLLGFLLAFPLWRQKQTILGNLAGSAVILAAALVLMLREYVELDRVTKACLDAGFTCWPTPGFFTRFAIYAGIGLVEMMALFVWSLRVERNIRNRGYAPEWR